MSVFASHLFSRFQSSGWGGSPAHTQPMTWIADPRGGQRHLHTKTTSEPLATQQQDASISNQSSSTSLGLRDWKH